MAEDAEVARRREIRQRKILENAEARLKKISGKYSVIDEAANQSNSNVNHIGNSVFSNHESGGIVNSTASCSYTKSAELLSKNDEHVHSQSSSQCPTDFFTGLPLSDKELASNGVIHRANTSDSYAFPKKVSDAETRSFGRTRVDSRRNSSCKQIMMETLQLSSLKCNILRPWIALVIGLCTKFFFIVYNSFFFFESLLLPYILLELSLYIWMKLETQGTVQSTTPQSLLLGALLLCGVSPNIVSNLNNVFCTTQYLIQDFAVYLFSFIMSHFLYENYVI